MKYGTILSFHKHAATHTQTHTHTLMGLGIKFIIIYYVYNAGMIKVNELFHSSKSMTR